MDAYQQYRARAEERLRQAQRAPEQHRPVLLEMACTLLRMAEDARSGKMEDGRPFDVDLAHSWRSLPQHQI